MNAKSWKRCVQCMKKWEFSFNASQTTHEANDHGWYVHIMREMCAFDSAQLFYKRYFHLKCFIRFSTTLFGLVHIFEFLYTIILSLCTVYASLQKLACPLQIIEERWQWTAIIINSLKMQVWLKHGSAPPHMNIKLGAIAVIQPWESRLIADSDILNAQAVASNYFLMTPANNICVYWAWRLGRTSDSTCSMASPADGRPRQPSTSTGVDGEASETVCPLSSNSCRTWGGSVQISHPHSLNSHGHDLSILLIEAQKIFG